MANYAVEIYDTLAAAETAIELLDDTATGIQLIAFKDGAHQKVAAVKSTVAGGGGVTGVGDGRKTVTAAGTAEALASSTTIKQVIITAETDNTDIVVVGGSTVVAAVGTRRGTPLYPGDTVIFDGDDLAEFYIDSIVNGEGVTFTYLT